MTMACYGSTTTFIEGMKVLEYQQKIEVKHISWSYQYYNALPRKMISIIFQTKML